MRSELETRIFGEEFAARLEEASRALAAQSQARLVALGEELGTQVKAEAGSRPCWAGKLDFAALGSLERDALRASVAASGGAAAGLVTARVLARRAAAAAAARASSKRAFQGAASLAGRVAAKRTGSTLVAAAGGAAVCGPFAPLCALVAAGATWIALDKAFITVGRDRLPRRDARGDPRPRSRSRRRASSRRSRCSTRPRSDRTVSSIAASMDKVFVPARDGT
jgi:hypothetical protein